MADSTNTQGVEVSGSSRDPSRSTTAGHGAPTPHAASDAALAFGEAVRARRLSLGLTADAVGAILGCSHQNVTQIERGCRSPNASTIAAFAKALRLDPVGLFLAAVGDGTGRDPSGGERD